MATHFSDDANTKYEQIETCDALKKELKDQFLPYNTFWVAKDSLRKLKLTEVQFLDIRRERYVREG